MAVAAGRSANGFECAGGGGAPRSNGLATCGGDSGSNGFETEAAVDLRGSGAAEGGGGVAGYRTNPPNIAPLYYKV